MRRFNIGNKIIIPVVITIFVMVLSILLVTRHFFVKNQNEVISSVIDNKVNEIINNIDLVGENALYSASICSDLESVKNAYQAYYRSGNLDSCAQLLEGEFAAVSERVSQNTGHNAKIHFHLPPATSFLRAWCDQRGDDISSFRNTIKEISRKHQPLYGIETGRGGFVIRGLAPIADQNQYLGSVEILYPISEIFAMTKLNKTEEFAIFMDTDLLSVASSFLESSASNVNSANSTVGDYILVKSSNENFKLNLINGETLSTGKAEKTDLMRDEFMFSVFPIKNYAGQIEGVAVYQLDISNFLQTLSYINTALLVCGIICGILAIIMILVVVRVAIIKPLGEANRITKSISKGNLNNDIKISSNDELGDLLISLNSMQAELRKIVDKINFSIVRLSSGSKEISSSSNTISSAASQQAVSTEELSATMEEMLKRVSVNLENAQSTDKLVSETSGKVKESNEISQNVAKSINSIIEKSKMIEEVAWQTHLLSLNASIEAARAGSAGKGFAVVANEVKKLASNSSDSAQGISDLSGEGLQVTSEAVNMIDKLVPEMETASLRVKSIAESSQQMREFIEDINKTILQLNDATQQNAASSEELAAASRQLSDQALLLQEISSFFDFQETTSADNQAESPMEELGIQEDELDDIEYL